METVERKKHELTFTIFLFIINKVPSNIYETV